MNWLDAVFLLVMAGSMAAGIARGFARISIGFAAAVLAVVLGLQFHATAGAFVRPYVGSRATAGLLGFLIVFIGVMIAGSLVAALLAKILKWVHLGWFDRLMGAVAGLLRGVVVCVAIVMAVMAFSERPEPPSIVGSSLAPYFVEAADVAIRAAPTELKDNFRKVLEQVKKLWVESFRSKPHRMPSREI